MQWLNVDDPEFLEVWENADLSPLDGCSPEKYFAYNGNPTFDVQHLRQSLKIADPVAGDSMIYVLNPMAVAEDGEWEAWRDAHWIPGAERYPSFALLMQAEYESFRATELNKLKLKSFHGPFRGVYAPHRPRRRAENIRRGSGSGR